MFVLTALPAVESRSAQPPFEVAVLGFCRDVAKAMDLEAKVDEAQVKALRAQAMAIGAVARESLPKESRVLPLLEAAQGALESLDGDPEGEARYGRAARVMALRWRSWRSVLPEASPDRVQELEALALFCELGGLRGTSWRDDALRLRARLAMKADPHLEKDLAAGVEDHYGPWLTMAEMDPMLEMGGLLLRAWGLERDGAALTRRVASQAMKENAERVWSLAARKGDENFREALGALLLRLDVSMLAKEQPDASLKLGGALLGTPLDAASRRFLKGLDGVARRARNADLRRRIARLLEDWETEADLLVEALRSSTSDEARLGLLGDAASLLEAHPQVRLLQEATRVLRKVLAKGGHNGEDGWGDALLRFSRIQSAAGQLDEAEALVRQRLDLEDPSGTRPEGRLRLLASLGRWTEVLERLGPPGAKEDLDLLGWRLRSALGLGQGEEVRAWGRAWIEAALALPQDPQGQVPVLPGLAAARPFLAGAADGLAALAGRFGAQVAPGLEAMIAQDPSWILVALDPEAQDSPKDVENALRWRMQRLSGDGAEAARALDELRQEAEKRLGDLHPLVAELLIKQAKLGKEPDSAFLERAVAILDRLPETDPDRQRLLVTALTAQAERAVLEGDGRAVERLLRRILDLPGLSEQPNAKELQEFVPLLLMIQLWREQRLDEITEFTEHLANQGAKDIDDQTRARLARMIRFQGQLKGAGLL